jgi:hypothetical protein
MVDDPNEWDESLGPPPTEQERAESERLRRALEDPRASHPGAELARALRAAVDPRPIDELSHRRILDRAVPKKARRVEVAMLFAAAAALVIGAVALGSRKHEAPGLALVKPHTTQGLFTEPFPREGKTSARVDAIALSRGRELRQNRWARWGLR